jgi:hypothetical protein
MNKIPQPLLSPNAWVAAFSILAASGILLCVLGVISGATWLTAVGLSMIAPIVMGGVILLFVIVPVLIIANRKQKR